MTDTFDWDACCGRRLAKALLAATEPLKEWTCPRCGCLWRPQIVGELRHWQVDAPVVVFRP